MDKLSKKKEIENAIRRTLVVLNSQSIPIAVDRIYELIEH